MCHRVFIFRKLFTWVGFNYPPWLGPKRHGTACAIGPKGEARTDRPHAPSVPKAKLGYTELRALSVPKAKLGHTELRALSVPKAKLGQFISVPM